MEDRWGYQRYLSRILPCAVCKEYKLDTPSCVAEVVVGVVLVSAGLGKHSSHGSYQHEDTMTWTEQTVSHAMN
jgi:hypothetical protein